MSTLTPETKPTNPIVVDATFPPVLTGDPLYPDSDALNSNRQAFRIRSDTMPGFGTRFFTVGGPTLLKLAGYRIGVPIGGNVTMNAYWAPRGTTTLGAGNPGTSLPENTWIPFRGPFAYFPEAGTYETKLSVTESHAGNRGDSDVVLYENISIAQLEAMYNSPINFSIRESRAVAAGATIDAFSGLEALSFPRLRAIEFWNAGANPMDVLVPEHTSATTTLNFTIAAGANADLSLFAGLNTFRVTSALGTTFLVGADLW